MLLCFWCCPTYCWSAWHSRWKGVNCISRIVPSCSEDVFTVISISDACCAKHTFFIAWWSYKIIGMYYFSVTIYFCNNSQSRWEWTVNYRGNLKHIFWLFWVYKTNRMERHQPLLSYAFCKFLLNYTSCKLSVITCYSYYII